jgi:hypothetical protein
MTTTQILEALQTLTGQRPTFFRALSNASLLELKKNYTRRATCRENRDNELVRLRWLLAAGFVAAHYNERLGYKIDGHHAELAAELEHYQQLFRASLTA